MDRDILNCDYMLKYAINNEERTKFFKSELDAFKFIAKERLTAYTFWDFKDLPF